MDSKTKQDNVPQVKTVEDRYSVALVFTRQTGTGSIETMLRNLICYAKSDKEALGYAIQYFEKESKGFGLICKCAIQIDESSRIAELEAGLLHQKEQNKRISNQIELSEEANAIVRAELEASNAKLREASVSVAINLPKMAAQFKYLGMGSHHKNCLTLIDKAEQALNSKEVGK